MDSSEIGHNLSHLTRHNRQVSGLYWAEQPVDKNSKYRFLSAWQIILLLRPRPDSIIYHLSQHLLRKGNEMSKYYHLFPHPPLIAATEWFTTLASETSCLVGKYSIYRYSTTDGYCDPLDGEGTRGRCWHTCTLASKWSGTHEQRQTKKDRRLDCRCAEGNFLRSGQEQTIYTWDGRLCNGQ